MTAVQHAPSHQAGSSLIEVLISILLLSTGLLAMAGLSASSASYNKLSQIRGTAAVLVNDYGERARVNLSGFDSGGYSKATTYSYSKTKTAEAGCTNAATAPCTPAALATFDQTQWFNHLKLRLPGGDAYIVSTSTASTRERTMDIWIMWTEQSQDTGLATSQTCPTGAAAPAEVSCMYFRVTL